MPRMTDIELIVQYMQHECVIAHSHACSVHAFALWPDVTANEVWLGHSSNPQAQALNVKSSSGVATQAAWALTV